MRIDQEIWNPKYTLVKHNGGANISTFFCILLAEVQRWKIMDAREPANFDESLSSLYPPTFF